MTRWVGFPSSPSPHHFPDSSALQSALGLLRQAPSPALELELGRLPELTQQTALTLREARALVVRVINQAVQVWAQALGGDPTAVLELLHPTGSHSVGRFRRGTLVRHDRVWKVQPSYLLHAHQAIVIRLPDPAPARMQVLEGTVDTGLGAIQAGQILPARAGDVCLIPAETMVKIMEPRLTQLVAHAEAGGLPLVLESGLANPGTLPPLTQ